MPGHPLVEQAHATLCRLADAPPAPEVEGPGPAPGPGADAAAALLAEIERAWQRPFVVGIGGEVPARTTLFNVACDAKVFDPFARAPGSAAVRLKRGPRAGFRAVRDDGTTEEHAEPPDRARDIATARERARAAATEVAERETALVRVEGTLPKRPAWWAVWMWLVYWIGMWLGRRQRTERALANLALGEARKRLATTEQDAAALEAHARLAKARYFEALRELASGGAIGSGVIEVELTLASTPLPDGVEIIELAGASRAGAELDAVLLAQGERVFAPDAPPVAIGDHAQALAALPALLADARALRLARRVRDKVTQSMASLVDAIARKEAGFRERIDRLHALRLADPAAFIRAQVDRVRPEISASITAVVEHSSAHLGAELAQLQQDWIGAIADAPDSDALKAALATLDEEWHARPQRIAEEFRVLVTGGLGGSARDLYPALVRELVPHGLPEEHARLLREAPELPALTLLPSLAKEPPKLERPGRLSGLFRSFEARRTEIRERVHERVERMRELAEAELLDAEPRLHHAIGDALGRLLEDAIAKQQAAIDAALDTERAAIDREREAIAPLVRVRDAVRAEAARLADGITELERTQPAIAVAAAAAETASLSR